MIFSLEKFREKFPGAVPFILTICYLERYAAVSIIAILVLYLNRKLNIDPSASTAILHVNDFLVYFFTIVGGIVGDSWWGAFKTICWMLLVYAAGIAIVAVGAIESLNVSALALTCIGLITITVGSGGVRPNMNALSGIQYKLPDQAEQLNFFFSIQYFMMKFGAMTACFVAPILHADVKCFGMDDCYPLAFGVPAIVMLISFIIFLCGSSLYVTKPASGNMLVKVIGCIFHALGERLRHGRNESIHHWLDYSIVKYGQILVNETKVVLNILILFIPLPIYWSGILLQNSRWVFQASKMNGDIGWFVIKPDQMLAFNSALSLILFPLCEYVLYPLLAKIGVKSLLHRITFGGIISAIALGISAVIETQIEKHFLNILWLIPQYFFMVISENFVYIATVNFAYNEAPSNMKSVMTSFVFVTIAGGNLLIALVTGTKVFSALLYESLFFTILVFVDMICFWFIARRYNTQTNRNMSVL
ncbi:peptide transporter family 1-like isoform X2 [Bradysia coprophila]|nr:peptide transporter family 1-like isoform X2 [Bradysia coprophila]